MLRLMRYNLQVKYTPGSQMYIADTLSRAYMSDQSDMNNDDDEAVPRIMSATVQRPATKQRLQEIRKASESGETLKKVKHHIVTGWPSHRGTTEPKVQAFWNLRHNLHVENNIAFFENRMIIPEALRKDILLKLHSSHLGVDKCKSRARESIFWSGITKDIELHVHKCNTRAKFRNSNRKEPTISHEIPNRPWAKLGADIFHFGGHDYLLVVDYFSNGGHDYLLVVDYFSKYPEIARLTTKTATAVKTVLRPIFARHGITDKLIADNMPFNSYQMKQFAKEWSLTITTSSPTYAQSNRQSERYIQTVKNLIRKAVEENNDPNLESLSYRNTPIYGLEKSPAQLLFGRRLQDQVPTATKLLKPPYADVKQKVQARQEKQKFYYGRATRHHKNFQLDDNVRVQLGKTWKRGVITKRHPTPRSYDVTTEDGATLRRNQRFINPSPDKAVIFPTDVSGNMEMQHQDRTECGIGDNNSSSPMVEPQSSPPQPSSASHLYNTTSRVFTRCGREVRQPNKLNL
ncbi:Pol polyprotein [Plakobranchus ocellatus]|uniref:Pol polyprotein n=1 Tax=Plakobranchus ocellatus TaxID=259542 RepID=A0AAV3Y876_9GAST|nr:Pol polyprotein [Plakobranchus ocellatus]